MRLQRVQNNAARIVADTHIKEGTSKILQELHWLPVAKRIEYRPKIILTVYKTLQTGQPAYLKSLLDVVKPTRSLRSSNNGLVLNVPFCKTVIASRAFAAYAPRLWNSLPRDLRDCVSNSVPIDVFKRKLKTVLFLAAYGVINV